MQALIENLVKLQSIELSRARLNQEMRALPSEIAQAEAALAAAQRQSADLSAALGPRRLAPHPAGTRHRFPSQEGLPVSASSSTRLRLRSRPQPSSTRFNSRPRRPTAWKATNTRALNAPRRTKPHYPSPAPRWNSSPPRWSLFAPALLRANRNSAPDWPALDNEREAVRAAIDAGLAGAL